MIILFLLNKARIVVNFTIELLYLIASGESPLTTPVPSRPNPA